MPLSPEAAELDAIFDAPEASLLRDQYDRPLLVPGPGLAADPMLRNRGGKVRPDGKLPYTRASSLANYTSDHTALVTWQQRSLTKGLGEREDLAAMAAGLPPIIANSRDKNTLSAEEKKQDKETNSQLDWIAEEAMKHANRDFKANWGTAVHSFTDPGGGTEVPDRMAADVASWHRATQGWFFHATETFVANDGYQAAGTFDHLLSIPWMPELGRMVCDKKTGLLHFDQVAVQLAVYATGRPYDTGTDKRYDWPDGIEPNQKWGLLAHIPLGLGRTDFYLVDLVQGNAAALVAIDVRAHRSNKTLSKPIDFTQKRREHVAGLISVADGLATMKAIHAEHQDVWTDALTAQGQQRLAELAASSTQTDSNMLESQ